MPQTTSSFVQFLQLLFSNFEAMLTGSTTSFAGKKNTGPKAGGAISAANLSTPY